MSVVSHSTARHILTYAQTLKGGGVERAQLRLAAGWVAAGRRVTIVIGDASGPLKVELPVGVELIEIGSSRYIDMLVVAEYARELQPDLIFCAGNHYTSIAGYISSRLGRGCPPVLAKISNALDRRDQGMITSLATHCWLRMHPWFIDHFVAMTPAMREETMARMKVPPARVSVIANPPARSIPLAIEPLLPSGRFILGVGRLARQKRWDRLIRALAALNDKTMQLVILGEGNERRSLGTLAANLGVGGRVLLAGHAADPLPAMARAAVVALTSDFEGVPGVLREALSVGTPVVSTESSVSVREIVHDPSLGSVVGLNDRRGLVAALEQWLAPEAPRPAPVPQPGERAATDYLALMDRLVGQLRR
jgi:glycosyltransferase involved in cell wall biosynthesis